METEEKTSVKVQIADDRRQYAGFRKLKRKRKNKKADAYETCIVCHEMTDIRRDTSVKNRECYIRGMGQLCRSCWNEYIFTYDK